MKKITGLNDRLEHYEDVPQGAEFLVPTVRQMLVKHLATAMGKPDSPEDSITLFDLASTVKKAPLDHIEIEDADFKTLSDAIRANRTQYVPFYQGQLLKRLKVWAEGEKK